MTPLPPPSPLDPIWIGEGADPDAARIDRVHRRPRTATPSSPDCLPVVLSVTYSSPSSPRVVPVLPHEPLPQASPPPVPLQMPRAAAAFSRSRLQPWPRVPAPTPLLLASPPPVPLLVLLPRAATFGPSLLAASPTRLWPLLAAVHHSPPPPCRPPAGDRPASPATFAVAPDRVALETR
nr:WAS/WASL-interacting protein family member 3-like [Aegilops tauschii subsp. strangulata]